MEPVISALSKKYQGKVAFIVVDVEKQDDPSVETLIRKYGIRYIPAIILIDHQGQIVEQQEGAVAQEVLTKQLDQLIQ